jgi:autotransporter adhesin
VKGFKIRKLSKPVWLALATLLVLPSGAWADSEVVVAFPGSFAGPALPTAPGSTQLNNSLFGPIQPATFANTNSTSYGVSAIAGSFSVGGNNTAIGNGTTAGGIFGLGNDTAVGQAANALGGYSTAVGQGAVAQSFNSVAIGANSAATAPNTVSVGAVGAERRITNVAPGINVTDAVNVGQMYQSYGQLNSHINRVERNANGGIAVVAAMAMSVMRPRPGKSTVNLGSGYFGGQSGLCVTAAHTARSGKFGMAGGVGTHYTTNGNGMVAAGGIGFEF